MKTALIVIDMQNDYLYEKRKDNAPVAMWGYVDSWGTSFFPKK